MRYLAVVVCVAAGAHGQDWPDLGELYKSHDCYNLGLLGAKASAADRHGDDPQRLAVRLLFPNGPAARAGLEIGDVIVGVNGARFEGGSLTPLAAALVDAEVTDGAVRLLVERKGTIAVTIPTGGAGRRAIVDRALRWLAREQRSDGGYHDRKWWGRNAVIVLTSLAGLAWVGAGSDLERGPHKDNVRRAAGFVIRHVRALEEKRETQQKAWGMSTWAWAYAAIFLGELHARAPDRKVRDGLFYCAGKLVEYQEKSGGWAHGPGGLGAHDYVELNIVTGFALGGLGLARQSGFDVPRTTLARAALYLDASTRGGGVGYSHRPGELDANIGRTAACWLGYRSLGLGEDERALAMGQYVEQHAGNVLGGHATLMQHIMLAGVAAHAHGERAKRNFWKVLERDLVLARAPDGTLQPRTWPEARAKGTNDGILGEVWTTASWTIVLVSEPGHGFVGFPAWSGRR